MTNITCGVPQGSILGPLLVLLYINNIVNCSVLSKYILSSDHSNLFYSDTSFGKLQVTINKELEKISQCFIANKLSLNINKTNFMFFGERGRISKSKISSFKLNIDGFDLERVTSTKFVGVYIDDKLSWKTHTFHVYIKISKLLGILNKSCFT